MTEAERRQHAVRLLYLVVLAVGVVLSASSYASLAPEGVSRAAVWREAAVRTLAWPWVLHWSTGVPQVLLLALIAVGVAQPGRWWGVASGLVGVGGWLFMGFMATGLMVT